MKTNLNIRCRFSKEWKVEAAFAYTLSRLGRIVGETKDKICWKVLWDGTKTIQAYHKNFIDIVEG